MVAGTGVAIAGTVLQSRDTYGELELASGRNSRLTPGDVILGVLGSRAALRGFSGHVPESVRPGDRLHILNVGGVIGVSDGTMVGLGDPIEIDVIGTPLVRGVPATLAEFSLPDRDLSPEMPPVIAVAGTCMNAGKSTAAAIAIRYLRAKGLTIHAGKATGVAALRDPQAFLDYGASLSLSFLDCGVPSTAYRSDVPALAKRLLAHLADGPPDAILLELGDGLLGSYGVDEILDDRVLVGAITGVVLAANDVVGAVAGVEALRHRGLQLLCVTGPATDNVAGREKLRSLGIPSANVFREPNDFCSAIEGVLP